MEIKIECPWCNQEYSVDESFVGQKVECTVCNKKFVVNPPAHQSTASHPTSHIMRYPAQQEKKTMKEYKVLTQKDKWFSGKFDPELLEKAINSYASQGWRVVTAATASFPGAFTANREEMIIIMERDK